VRKGFIESVAGNSISEVSFEFDYPAPAHSDLYGRELGVPVRFDRSHTAMVIPESLLDRECATADPAMFASAIDRLEAKQRQLDDEHSVIGHVEVLLDASGDAGVPVEEAASALGMSRRSLTRRLSEAGTSFRAVRDHHRRSRAELLLRDRSLDLDEIAWRLGYGNVANLGRATRRWFGMPPGRYRHSLE
jgi:AraC-like DNA-binding protein